MLGDKVGFNNAYAIALLMATAGTFFDFIPRFSYLTRQSTVTLAKGNTEGVYFLDSMSFVPDGKYSCIAIHAVSFMSNFL